ncbi:hypothetical protein HD806DRAFT_518523 [Xylariaceae sp. AK1471]|nr:hypothetical protein HD806DRAFT_518523 [Xylariaceae sp. AK1471]
MTIKVPPFTLAATLVIPGVISLFIIWCILRGFHIHPYRWCRCWSEKSRQDNPPPVIPLHNLDIRVDSTATVESIFISQDNGDVTVQQTNAFAKGPGPNVRYALPAPYSQEDQNR